MILIGTAGVIFLLALVLGRVIEATTRDEALAAAERTAGTLSEFSFEEDEFRHGLPTKESLEDMSDIVNSSETISGFRVLNAGGRVLHSSDGTRSGTTLDAEDVAAVFDGEATSEVTSVAAEQDRDEESVADGDAQELLEVNVPIGEDRNGQPLAALALYESYEPVAKQISSTTTTANIVLGGAALLLYLLLIPILLRASRALANAIDPRVASVQRALLRAMDQGDLVLHYQPKVVLATGRTVGVEALVRWQDPDRGLIPPGDFLPAAEAGEVIGVLTQHVFELACAQRAAWRFEGVELPIAVNFSAKNLVDDSLPEKLSETLLRHAVAADDFTIEITESVVMEDFNESRRVVERLSDMGFRISVDDFGTGYSSLARLGDLPIDELKIDRAFTSELAASGRTAVVKAIIAIGHEVGLSVVAEGVEDASTFELLRKENCDQIQGFYITRPLPASALTVWMTGNPFAPPEIEVRHVLESLVKQPSVQ